MKARWRCSPATASDLKSSPKGCVACAACGLVRHEFELIELPFGGRQSRAADPLPEHTLLGCLAADAVLLGAIGGPKCPAPQAPLRPEAGLLRLRRSLGTFANLRPVQVHPALADASTLKRKWSGVDLLFVRELTGGIYFGDKRRDAHSATDVCTYTVAEIERITRVAARLAQSRRRRLTSIDKANVLETSRLWREVSARVVAREFPDLTLEHMLVDAAAMHLIRRPRDFDVLVTENMFGDILTDQAAMLAALWDCCRRPRSARAARHLRACPRSAPDIAGAHRQPFGTILSVALLLRHSLDLGAEPPQSSGPWRRR